MGLSKIVLNMAEKVRPVLVKIIPASTLSSIKAKVISNGAKKLENIEIEKFDKKAYPLGINLVGSIRSDTGLGQSMRLVADIVNAGSRDFMIYNYFVPPGDVMTNKSYDHKIEDEFKYNINIFHINPSELPVAFMSLGKEKWDKHYNIGYWLWELEDFPKEWMPSFHLLDEIWTPSDFITNTLKKYTDKPVRTIPYSVTAPIDNKYDRKYFNLPEDKFLYLMMFDSGSGMTRKNPLSIIESYKKAFPTEQENAGLIVKINELEQSTQDIEFIKEQLKGYKNVYFICKTLSKTEVNSLTACADVYVSLHRAEGFGLVLAESMIVGTPVVATNWSANTEFMNSDVACMVDYSIVPLEKDIPPFKKGYKWAQADTDQAAKYMKQLYEDKEFYDTIKNKAEIYIKEKLGMKRSVALMEDRLKEILDDKH